MAHDYPIYINVINTLGQKKSKSSLIILPKMCNIMDYVINYSC